ncbi:hypothetical protein [Flavobacterium nackdongense]|uniref:Hydrolase n=1 Tax=Flavobacterium nackdongense TaxID=2547394 RepID=A0A4P6Y5E2_9FLAO|nr:hypothetical protein [Flavobacterium nackdongense]QBN17331.1 hypothetical protein E1750_00435 [Flavobacterium nackdongense]
MKKIIIIIFFFSIVSCEKQNQEKNLLVEKLKSENNFLKQKNDSLNNELKNAKSKKNYWFDVEFEGVKLVNKGIKDPENYIENSLRERPELIPLNPILGGNMVFDKIQILGEEWIIADYSDGHVQGKAIYSYKVNNDAKVEFLIMNSFEPN